MDEALELHYISIISSICHRLGDQQENITIGNIYVPKLGVPKYIKQIFSDKKGKVIVIW